MIFADRSSDSMSEYRPSLLPTPSGSLISTGSRDPDPAPIEFPLGKLNPAFTVNTSGIVKWHSTRNLRVECVRIGRFSCTTTYVQTEVLFMLEPHFLWSIVKLYELLLE